MSIVSLEPLLYRTLAAHGTFIGSIRLEPHKATQLPIDSSFHFGASTRVYIIRERPQSRPIMDELEGSGTVSTSGSGDGGLLGLPETEMELDNLTEFNTAHNRRISMLGILSDDNRKMKTPRKTKISFNEEEEIINPEDVDPSVGRFRNMVETTVIPRKVRRIFVSILQESIVSVTFSLSLECLSAAVSVWGCWLPRLLRRKTVRFLKPSLAAKTLS